MLAFDQNTDPFGDIPITQPPRAPSRPPMLGQQQPLAGPPRAPTPQTPEQQQGQALQNQHTSLENQNLPITAAAQAANAARARQEVQQGNTQGVNFTDENTLRQQYRSDPRVQGYETILPLFHAAQTAADTPAGDYNVVTAFAKISDPSTGIRQGEQAGVEDAATVDQRIAGLWNYYTHGQGRLTPETRAQLMAELARRGAAWDTMYNTVRGDVRHDAQRYGFDPQAVIGTHAALPFRQQMGIGVPNVQVQAPQRPDHSGQDLRFWDDPVRPAEYAPRDPTATVQQAGAQAQQLFDQGATLDQMNAFAAQHGLGPWGSDMAHAIQYRDRGGRGARIQIPPRPPERQIPQGDPNNFNEAVGANIRGASNAATSGLDHPITAAVNTLAGGGNGRTFRENLWMENAYDQANMQSHPWATIAGNIEGAALLPTGAPASARAAAQAAIRAGATRTEAIAAARMAAGTRLAGEGAIYGGIHGTATGDGSFTDRLKNGALEAGTGALGGFGMGRFGPSPVSIPREPLPPLVDPVTGRLNQPLESASPAERVAAAQAQGMNLPMGAATDRGGAIIEKGLDMSPVSAGLMNDARRGTEAETTNALENVAGNFGQARSPFDAGTSAQTGARSWIDRATVAARPGQPSVVGRAYDAIPISPNTDSVLSNTRATLDRLTSRFQSNPELAAMEQNQQLVRYRDALASGGLSWNDLKALRSEIGARIGSERFSDSPSRDDLRGLYGALSEDMRATAASQGPRALQLFERANDLNRNVETRIEQSLVPILGNDSRQAPERAAAYIQSLATGGRVSSNLNQLAAVRASLVKGGHWDDVASGLIRLGGQPANSPGRAFDPQTFIRWYSDLPEQARGMLFAGRNGQLRQSLDNFVAVAQRLSNTNALRNTSNTTPTRAGLGTVLATSGATAGLLTHPIVTALTGAAAAGGAGVNYAMAKAWTNPNFVRAVTQIASLGQRGARVPLSAAAVQAQRQRLLSVARASPEIAGAVLDLDHRLFGGNGDNNGNQPQ